MIEYSNEIMIKYCQSINLDNNIHDKPTKIIRINPKTN